MTPFLTKLTSTVEAVIGRDSLPCPGKPDGGDTDALQVRALARVHRREIERQRNLEKIVELASAEMQEEVADDAVPADWLALYFNLAQDVSEAATQLLWARILALQVAVPDAVFKRTLIHLHAMDQWEVEAFVEYCSFAFAFESGWRFVFEEAITRQEMWGYVRGNDYTQHFINIGLLVPELSRSKPTQAKGLRIRYYEREYELIGAADVAGGDDAAFGYRRFSVTGQQLTKAIRAKTCYGYARNVIKALEAERSASFQPVEDPAAP